MSALDSIARGCRGDRNTRVCLSDACGSNCFLGGQNTLKRIPKPPSLSLSIGRRACRSPSATVQQLRSHLSTCEEAILENLTSRLTRGHINHQRNPHINKLLLQSCLRFFILKPCVQRLTRRIPTLLL